MNIPNVKHFSHKLVERTKHHIKKVSQFIYEKGDPDFVDERKKEEPKEESFFDYFLNFFKRWEGSYIFSSLNKLLTQVSIIS